MPLAVERLTFKAILTNEAPVKIVSITLSTRLPICEAVEVTPLEYDVVYLLVRFKRHRRWDLVGGWSEIGNGVTYVQV